MLQYLLLVISISFTQSLQYSQHLAIEYLYYARVAQCNDTKIAVWECGVPCEHFPYMQNITVFFNKSHHAQGYTAYDPANNIIAVGFRGSHGIINWINNLDFVRMPYPNCQDCLVHTGFYKTYLDLQEDILTAVKSLKDQYKSARMIVTGHSLGAALSTLAAIDIKRQIGNIEMFYNYGSPRVGNKQFADYFKSLIPNAFRLTHYRDPVPHLPLRWMGFHHVAREIWYSDQNSTTYVVCNDSGEDIFCADSQLIWNPDDHEFYIDIFCDC